MFNAELKHLLVNQKMAFNSPVWFNVGVEAEPQCSACFINSVDDSMESILGLAKTEGMLFKYGSGTGTNLSPIRSSKELLNGGGTASGPVCFMKGFDAFAGVIKSGGKTRRAAKMVILNVEHPDIDEFVSCKVKEEKKAWALIDAGYDGSFNGEAYGSVFFQNSNNSVRVTDEFMDAVEHDREWHASGARRAPVETVKARELWREIAEAAWQCGDPGLQFDTTINDWHTSTKTARINASNPCSEYMYLDDWACNLASLNLRKFVARRRRQRRRARRELVPTRRRGHHPGAGDHRRQRQVSVGEDRRQLAAFRPLGLGYANLGALLMSRGLPYDIAGARLRRRGDLAHVRLGLPDQRRHRARRDRSVRRLRREQGAVPRRHGEAPPPGRQDRRTAVPYDLMDAARDAWDETLEVGREHGFRNGQVTVLAPTGTIGFMMDCDTTGIEPDIALVKYKRLVGGGMLKIVNNTVPEALTSSATTRRR